MTQPAFDTLVRPRTSSWETVPVWVLALTVSIVVVGTYATTAGFGFAFDDQSIIVQNTAVHTLSLPSLLAAKWFGSLYRPATLLSFALDWAVGSGDPTIFHVVNIVLHLGVTLCVLALTVPVLGRAGALAAALLFAVHPVHVEAVANIVGRAEILAALGVIGSVLCYRRADAAQSPLGRALAWAGTLVCAVLAMAAKENGFLIPPLLLTIEWLDARACGEPVLSRLRRHAGLFGGVMVVWILSLAAWINVVGGVVVGAVSPALYGLSPWQRALVTLGLVPQYLRLLLVPVHLSADYSPNYLSLPPTFGPPAAAGLLVLILVVGVAVAARKRSPALTAGILWGGVSLSIVSNLIVPTEILLAERTMYLPSVGIAVLFGAIVAKSVRGWPRASLLAASVIVVLGCVRSVVRLPVWRDNSTLFPSIVRDAPGSFRADWLGGMMAYSAGRRDEGRALVARAVTINPREPGLLMALTGIYERDSSWAAAGHTLSMAYDARPADPLYAVWASNDFVRAHELDSATIILGMARSRSDTTFYPLRIAQANLAEARGQLAEALAIHRAVASEMGVEPKEWQAVASLAERLGACAVLDDAMHWWGLVQPESADLSQAQARRARVRCQR